MATTVQITDHGQTAKIRNPWGVAGLTLITLGIYYLVWYYKVNREMSDWGAQNRVDIGTSPGMSLIAITLGSVLLGIPPLVSLWATGKRMQFTQRAADVHGGSGLLWFVLHLIPIVSLFAPVYLQTQLNKAWETRPEQEIGTPAVTAELPEAQWMPTLTTPSHEPERAQ
jgi:hypothetical protein